MWPYWTLFFFLTLPIILQVRAGALNQSGVQTSGWWVSIFVLLVLMIGLRHEVGGDWLNYIDYLETVADSILDVLVENDPAYALLNWFAAKLDLTVYFVNTVGAIFFAWGLLTFCRAQPLPFLALVVSVPYLITVVAMGYSRQGVAIGIVMLGLVSFDRGHILRAAIWLIFAATFHKSALILLPLTVLSGTQLGFFNVRRVITLIFVGIATTILYAFLLQDSVENLNVNYLEAQYQSSGAAVRIAMNALPATLFLIWRRRFDLLPAQRTLWTWIAVVALSFVVLLELSPSSTAVDRAGLYCIPLQMFVWARLPIALGKNGGVNGFFAVAVVGYSALVLFVWLFYAEYSWAWIPYQFYPLVWLQG